MEPSPQSTAESGEASGWTPLTQRPIDPEFVRKMAAFHTSGASANPFVDQVHEVWANDQYEVIVRYIEPRGKGGALHLSIKRYDREPARDWRHLQSIKNEIAGWEREAFELFPRESRLVDQANQTHLWVMEAGVTLEIGFRDRDVKTEAESRAAMQAVLGPGPDKGRQRDWEPGISTGPEFARRRGIT